MAGFEDSGVDVIRFAAVDMEHRVVRVNALTAMLTIATHELKAARVFVRLIYQADGEVLGEVVALPDEDPEGVLAVCRFERHVVSLHPTINTQLSFGRVVHLLWTTQQIRKFFISECAHGFDISINGTATSSSDKPPWASVG